MMAEVIVKDASRKLFVNWGDIEVFRFLCEVNDENMPCPDDISNHPWSIDLRELMVINMGVLNINWVDNGTRNHILAEASWIKGLEIRRDVF